MKKENKINYAKFCIEKIEQYPCRLGQSIYYRVERNGKYEMMDIESDEFYDFMMYKLFYEEDFEIKRIIWDTATRIIKGKYGRINMDSLCNRVAKYNGSFYYDIQDIDSEHSHYVRVDSQGWEIVEEECPMLAWSQLQVPQCFPNEQKADIKVLYKYLNLDKDDLLLYVIYLISLLVPDIQYPILNIVGEHGTGKSTISAILKRLVDPSRDECIGLTNNEEDLILPLGKNHVTVYDNTESLPKRLNETLCKTVTGGQIPRRKRYTDSTIVLVDLKSAIVINGISSVISREDLMSRTIFIKTKSNAGFGKAKVNSNNMIQKNFEEDKPKILAGMFDILSKAISIKQNIKINKYYRMMDFAEWGYAIAEAMEYGLGNQFLSLLDKNCETQLQESYMNEPLISLICNYMELYGGDGINRLTSSFYDDILRHIDLLPGGSAVFDKKYFPHNVATFSKKIKSLRSIFEKLGLEIDIYQSADRQHISKIAITKIVPQNEQNNVEEIDKGKFKRKPIYGLRKSIFLQDINLNLDDKAV